MGVGVHKKIDNKFKKSDKFSKFIITRQVEEVRIGFNTLNDTLNTMFDLTAKSVRANKKVSAIMETAYSEAAEEYTEIKKSKK